MTLSQFLLVTALSLDIFSAALCAAVQGIVLPAASRMVISGVSALALGSSIVVAERFCLSLLPEIVLQWLSFGVLFLLSLSRFLEWGLKKIRANLPTQPEAFQVSVGSVRFILQIYLDSSAADTDRSRILSAKEAVPLSVALSLDALAAGLSGLGGDAVLSGAVCFGLSMLALGAGVWAGGRTKVSGEQASLLSGGILMTLALMKLF